MKGIRQQILGLSGVGLFTLLVSTAHASGYKLEFQSASTLADAGDAAVVEDAGTNWYNAAGLVYLPQQLALSSIAIYERTTIRGLATAPNGFGGSNYSATGTAHSNILPILPAMHYSVPFYNRFAFGLTIAPAWGLSQDYGENSFMRYTLNRIYSKSLDVSPSLAMKFNDHWSIGLGPDIHYFSIQAKSHALTEGLTAGDSISRYSLNDWGHGWHAGLLYRLNEATRIGLNYRSRIVMHMQGFGDFSLDGGPAYETNLMRVNIPLPPTTSLSVYHEINPRFGVMGTVAYDQWSVNKYLNGLNFQSVGTTTNVVLQQRFKNTWDFSAGTRYQLNDKWLLRGSLKMLGTPTVNQYRYANFTDNNRFGINLGARYQVNKKVAVDMIYARVFTPQVHVHDTNPASGALLDAQSNVNIDLIGAQLVWDI